MLPGAGPLAHAAVDVLLQLLHFCRRSSLIGDDAPCLRRLNGPKLLAKVGYDAIEQGAAS